MLRAQVIVIFDADMVCEPEFFERMLAELADPSVALARALFGEPFLLVLDEPNSNLDAIGESSLQNALLGAKARGAVVIVIAHRPSVLAMCDKLLILSNGMQQAFGPREDLLKKVTGQPSALEPPRPPAALRPTQIGKAG